METSSALQRYRISEVEAWLHEQYGWPQAQ
jgi:hypothetical protein